MTDKTQDPSTFEMNITVQWEQEGEHSAPVARRLVDALESVLPELEKFGTIKPPEVSVHWTRVTATGATKLPHDPTLE